MYFEPSKDLLPFPLLLVSMIWINDIIFLRKVVTREENNLHEDQCKNYVSKEESFYDL